jgi:hypothetical protein
MAPAILRLGGTGSENATHHIWTYRGQLGSNDVFSNAPEVFRSPQMRLIPYHRNSYEESTGSACSWWCVGYS